MITHYCRLVNTEYKKILHFALAKFGVKAKEAPWRPFRKKEIKMKNNEQISKKHTKPIFTHI